jgi:hypothetical protein
MVRSAFSPSPSPGTDAPSLVEGEPPSLCPAEYHQALLSPVGLVLVTQTEFDDYIVSGFEESLYFVPKSIAYVTPRTLSGHRLVHDVKSREIIWSVHSPPASDSHKGT